jgi:hypothetical protein
LSELQTPDHTVLLGGRSDNTGLFLPTLVRTIPRAFQLAIMWITDSRRLNDKDGNIMSREYLAIYLNDHLAGSLIAIEILEHLETEASDSMPDLPALKADIEADRQQLKMLMDRLGITESRVRKLTSWIAEQVTEAKFEADDESRGILRRLERLEALGIGIDGKSALWWALNAAAEVAPDLRGTDYKHLAQRAQEQRGRVEILRLQAARLALVPEII